MLGIESPRIGPFGPRGRGASTRPATQRAIPTACRVILFAAVALLASPALAQESEAVVAPSPAELTTAQVQEHLEEVQKAADLEEQVKSSLIETYKIALLHLEQAAKEKARAEEYARRRQEAPAAIETIREKIANPPSDPAVSPEIPLAKLEQVILEQRGALTAEEEALAARDKEIKLRADRRLVAPKASAAAKARLEELDHLLATPDAADADRHQNLARRTSLAAERQRTAAELEALKQELLFFEATDELLPLQRDEAFRQRGRTESYLKRLWARANTLRRDEAEQSSARAQAALNNAAAAHPVVGRIARENARIADERTRLIGKHQHLWKDYEADRTRAESLTKDLARMQQRASLGGLENLGTLLRQQGARLPDPRQLRRSAASLRTALADAELALFEYQDQRAALSDVEELVAAALNQLDGPVSLAEHDDVELALRENLESERQNLDALIALYGDHTRALDRLATARDELAKVSEEYKAFVAERVLWVRSADPLNAATFQATMNSLQLLADSRAWISLGDAARDDLLRRPLHCLLPLVLLALIVRAPVKLRRRLRDVDKTAARSSTDTFRPTAHAVVCTAALASLVPALMGIIAWRLRGISSSPLAEALASGLLATAMVYLPTEALRQIARSQGLGEAHFGWSPRSLGSLRRSLLRLMFVGLPLVFLFAAINSQDNTLAKDSLGRLAFVALMMVVAIFLWRVLRPVGGVLQEAIALSPGGWLDRFRLAWYPAATGAPLILALLAGLGFSYTAVQLAWRMQATLGLILLLILFHALARRWLLVARRRLAMEQARKRRAALSESIEAGSSGADMAPPELEQADLSVINLQTRKLLQSVVTLALFVGLYVIWVEVLPALRILNQREMWSVDVVETVMDADGAPQERIERLPVTWGHGLLALVVIGMTVLATRNIPGLLEITILQRLPMEPSGRYAVTTISRYLIILTGIVFTCGQLGLGWSRVQWLAAAVTVGLGFGLQEIFANFVSGLIILFERPIRVGDTITVAGVTGNVSRIRIRATTITDHDRKELIVPNKEFITGQVLNWTLSDPVVRMTIPVGVSYDSDPDLVQRLILQVANEVPTLLKEPAPTAYFEGFGDSTLNFTLRVFIPGLEHFLATRHALHKGIIQALRAAQVEIAFPQRDIHIKTVPPLVPVGLAEPNAWPGQNVPATRYSARAG